MLHSHEITVDVGASLKGQTHWKKDAEFKFTAEAAVVKVDEIFCKKVAKLKMYGGNGRNYQGKTFLFPISHNQRFNSESMENYQALVNELNTLKGIKRVIIIPTFSLQAINDQINELTILENNRKSLFELRKAREDETEEFIKKLEKKAFKHLRIRHDYRSWNYYINLDYSKPTEGISRYYDYISSEKVQALNLEQGPALFPIPLNPKEISINNTEHHDLLVSSSPKFATKKKLEADPEQSLIVNTKLLFTKYKNKLLAYYNSEDGFEKAVKITVGERYNQIIQQNTDKKDKTSKIERKSKIPQVIFEFLRDYVIEETATYYLWRDLYPGAIMFYPTKLNDPINWVQSNKRGLQTGLIEYAPAVFTSLKSYGNSPQLFLPDDTLMRSRSSSSGSSSGEMRVTSPKLSPREDISRSCNLIEIPDAQNSPPSIYGDNIQSTFFAKQKQDSDVEKLQNELLKKEVETSELKTKLFTTSLLLDMSLDPAVPRNVIEKYRSKINGFTSDPAATLSL